VWIIGRLRKVSSNVLEALVAGVISACGAFVPLQLGAAGVEMSGMF
jgi:hypothetical protein